MACIAYIYLIFNMSQEGSSEIIGSAMYLMNNTRPHIAYDVSRLNRYTHNPSSEHWTALVLLW